MKKFLMVIIVSVFLISACSNENKTISTSNTYVSKADDERQEVPGTIYADDEIINEFITQFNNESKYDVVDISKGNIRIKYHGYINGHWIEFLSGDGGLSLSINGGQDEDLKQSMFDVMHEVLKVADKTLTDDEIQQVTADLNASKYMINAYIINENITIGTYVPIVEQSYGNTTCRVDLVLHNYN